MDLAEYGIDPSVIAFNDKDSEPGQNILTTRMTLDLFRHLLDLKYQFLLLIFEKAAGSHRPYICATFRELADELGTNSRVLRKFSKRFVASGHLILKKLKPEDGEPDAYLFSMGSEFGKWIWNSNLYQKKLTDHKKPQITPNPAPPEPQGVLPGPPTHSQGSFEEPQRVPLGPPNDTKGSHQDPQRVSEGPHHNFQPIDIIKESPDSDAPVFSLSSKTFMSSSLRDLNDQKPKSGTRTTSKTNWTQPQDEATTRMKLKLQREYLLATDGGQKQSFEEWQKAVGK